MNTTTISDIVKQVEELYNAQDMYGVKELAMKYKHDTELLNDSVLYSSYLEFIANASHMLSDYVDAVYFYNEAIRVNTLIGNKVRLSAALGNIGLTKLFMGDFTAALSYLEMAIPLNEEIGNKNYLATNLNSVGLIFSTLSELDKALEYQNKSLSINMEINNLQGIGSNLGNIGLLLKNQGKFEEALIYYKRAMDIHLQLNDKQFVAVGYLNMGIIFSEMLDYTKAFEYYQMSLSINEDIHDKSGIASTKCHIGILYFKQGDYDRALHYVHESMQLSKEIESNESFMQSLQILSDVYEALNDHKKSLQYFKEFVEIRDIIQSDETKKKVLLFDQQRKIEAEDKIRQLQIARMEEQEKLLHKILPTNIADRILKRESSIADYYPSVTVMFIDIVGFTNLSSYLSPKQLVFLLNMLFSKVDEILDEHGLEKIKTIGDGYLAVANLTKPIIHHEVVAANAAIALIKTLKTLDLTAPDEINDEKWKEHIQEIQLRIGLHSGEVVAGIVGKNKFLFDLWGDAVNIASRMESSSEPGRIQVSQVFASRLVDDSSLKTIARGTIDIKGKGVMQTYWLE
jgi:adenylate cyclase